MSYPYPYKVDRNLWASFSLFKPKIGETIQTPNEAYHVLAVLPGKHCSAGLMLEHPELKNISEIPNGWFWYGIKIISDATSPPDRGSEMAFEDWKAIRKISFVFRSV